MSNSIISISIDDFEVLKSGSMIASNINACIRFNILLTGFNFSVELRFLEDSNEKTPLVKSHVDKNVVFMDCINFHYPQGSGMFKNVEIAEYQKRKIYFQFWTHIYGSNDEKCRQVEYSFLIEKEGK